MPRPLKFAVTARRLPGSQQPCPTTYSHRAHLDNSMLPQLSLCGLSQQLPSFCRQPPSQLRSLGCPPAVSLATAAALAPFSLPLPCGSRSYIVIVSCHESIGVAAVPRLLPLLFRPLSLPLLSLFSLRPENCGLIMVEIWVDWGDVET
ncbi:hypothetical protein NL676_011918 [Syzygium grande]|nr:hypothetical protein NL676_011918 [Syzygium grande]